MDGMGVSRGHCSHRGKKWVAGDGAVRGEEGRGGEGRGEEGRSKSRMPPWLWEKMDGQMDEADPEEMSWVGI